MEGGPAVGRRASLPGACTVCADHLCGGWCWVLVVAVKHGDVQIQRNGVGLWTVDSAFNTADLE
jgi:hypothetical protein